MSTSPFNQSYNIMSRETILETMNFIFLTKSSKCKCCCQNSSQEKVEAFKKQKGAFFLRLLMLWSYFRMYLLFHFFHNSFFLSKHTGFIQSHGEGYIYNLIFPSLNSTYIMLQTACGCRIAGLFYIL